MAELKDVTLSDMLAAIATNAPPPAAKATPAPEAEAAPDADPDVMKGLRIAPRPEASKPPAVPPPAPEPSKE